MKMGICAGAIILAGIGALVIQPSRYAVAASVRGFEDDGGTAILWVTNETRRDIRCWGVAVYVERQDGVHEWFRGLEELSARFFLQAHKGLELKVRLPDPSPSRLYIHCNETHGRIYYALRNLGIGSWSTGSVTTIDLPPR
jgi:hypothetical protein